MPVTQFELLELVVYLSLFFIAVYAVCGMIDDHIQEKERLENASRKIDSCRNYYKSSQND